MQKPPSDTRKNQKGKGITYGNTDSIVTDTMFRFNMSVRTPLPKKVVSFFGGRIEKALFLHRLKTIYIHVAAYTDPEEFSKRTLRLMNISCEINTDKLASVPKEGPLAIISNHPYGAIEGLILISVLLRIRPDTKIVANYLLGQIPQLREVMFCVDPFETESAIRQNIKPMKDVVSWLKAGHAVALFPAGEVSSINLRNFQVTDPEWHTTAARIIRKAKAAVLPVFFEGSNSALFQVAGLFHPRLRTVLLPYELLNKKHKTIKVRIGAPIPFQKIETFDQDKKLTAYLRTCTYILSKEKEKNK
jgi:putative hemolysin